MAKIRNQFLIQKSMVRGERGVAGVVIARDGPPLLQLLALSHAFTVKL
jgi:hypothetical protein